MIKKIYLFFLIVLILLTSPFLIRYLLSNKKISILNSIYFNYPGIINRKKTCPSYDALLNTTLDNSFSVSIINNKGTLISSYNDEMPRLPASNQKITILNSIYFNFPGIITKNKRCPTYDALLNQTLDDSLVYQSLIIKGE